MMAMHRFVRHRELIVTAVKVFGGVFHFIIVPPAAKLPTSLGVDALAAPAFRHDVSIMAILFSSFALVVSNSSHSLVWV